MLQQAAKGHLNELAIAQPFYISTFLVPLTTFVICVKTNHSKPSVSDSCVPVARTLVPLGRQGACSARLGSCLVPSKHVLVCGEKHISCHTPTQNKLIYSIQ